MSEQTTISFPTTSPINIESILVKNSKIFLHLMEGKTINTFDAQRLYGTRHLHSRIPEISKSLKDYDVKIERKLITVTHNGKETKCMSYWISEEDRKKLEGNVKLAA